MKVGDPTLYVCGRCGFRWTVPPAPACPACFPRRVLDRVRHTLRWLNYATRPAA